MAYDLLILASALGRYFHSYICALLAASLYHTPHVYFLVTSVRSHFLSCLSVAMLFKLYFRIRSCFFVCPVCFALAIDLRNYPSRVSNIPCGWGPLHLRGWAAVQKLPLQQSRPCLAFCPSCLVVLPSGGPPAPSGWQVSFLAMTIRWH